MKSVGLRIIVTILALTGVALYFYLAYVADNRDRAPIEVVYESYHFEPEDCWFSLETERQLTCGRLHTPTASGRFVLPVVIIRDDSPDRRPDPLLYIPGGPGGSAGLRPEELTYWLDWLEFADLRRDLVLMDPRGTGYSRPQLICDAYERFSQRILRRNTRILEELREGEPILRQCFDDLDARGFEPDHYGTRVSARDLAGLMSTLKEYREWNLLGISYGTRLGLIVPEYADRLRSLILDSVYPPDQLSFQEWPALLGNALERFFTWCQATGCHGARDLETDFYLALERSRGWPQELSVQLWDKSASMQVVVNDHRLLSAVFSAIYSVYSWDDISRAITGVLENDRRALQPLVESWINISFSQSFSSLVFMLVDCQDEPAGSEEAYMASVAAWPRLAPYTRDFWAYDACRWLISEPVSLVEVWQPPALPALLLAGAQDPITPSGWAEALHQRWPKSQLLVREGLGHGITDSDPCVLAGLREFLDHPEQPWQPDCD